MNLRRLSDSDRSQKQSRGETQAGHISTLNFVVPSDPLGNIGEDLDHSQSHRPEDDVELDGEESCEVTETSEDTSSSNLGKSTALEVLASHAG